MGPIFWESPGFEGLARTSMITRVPWVSLAIYACHPGADHGRHCQLCRNVKLSPGVGPATPIQTTATMTTTETTTRTDVELSAYLRLTLRT